MEADLRKTLATLEQKNTQLVAQIRDLERDNKTTERKVTNDMTEFFNSIISEIRREKAQSEEQLKRQVVFLEDAQANLENELVRIKRQKEVIERKLNSQINQLKRELSSIKQQQY